MLEKRVLEYPGASKKPFLGSFQRSIINFYYLKSEESNWWQIEWSMI